MDDLTEDAPTLQGNSDTSLPMSQDHSLPLPDLTKLNFNPDPPNPISSSNNEDLPPHRSHDPEKNLKRSGPFQFGSRYLLEDDDVFEFNAWDHVETDDDYKRYAEAQYAKQRERPVSEFDKSMLLFSFLFIMLSSHLLDMVIMPSHSLSFI